tara:strand:+ start:16307 stop:18178 length:1872 start_codon:yes stop_codon:yes gene_type:complete
MSKINYRPEIDGLRAIAVLPVILFHAGFSYFSGGYVGVDVFFVISGYLITLMIVEETKNNSFSLSRFYERRIRRIVPALFLVILLCIPFMWFLMMPYEARYFSQSLVSVVFFASNFLFWQRSNYFEQESELNPLLHTWSLAVEEQFYIFFPLLIMIFWKFGKKKVFYILLVIAALSLILSEYQSKNFPSANFYLSPSRAWELLAGSLLAMYLMDREPLKNNFMSLLGLILVIFSILNFDDQTRFPSLYTLFPVLGSCLIIMFSHRDIFVGRILSSSLMVQLGLISYSAYLFHQPLFSFARIYSLGHPPVLVMVVLAIITLFLAYISWKFVETPFRNREKVSTKLLLKLFLFFSIFIFSLGIIGHITNGFFNLKTSFIDDNKQKYIFDRDTVYKERSAFWKSSLKNSTIPFDSNKKEKILVLGDSVGKDFYVSAIQNTDLYDRYQFRYIDLDDECMNFNSMSKSLTLNCEKIRSLIFKGNFLEEADQIILSADWSSRTWQNPIFFSEFIPNKKPLKVIGGIKFKEASSIALRSAQNNLTFEEMGNFAYATISNDIMYSKLLKKQVQTRSNIFFYDKYEAFCDNEKKNCNLFEKEEGIPYIWDRIHLTIEGAKFFSTWIAHKVLN